MPSLMICGILILLSNQVFSANNPRNEVDMNDIDAEEIFQTVNNAIKLGQWQNKIERDIESIEAGMYSFSLNANQVRGIAIITNLDNLEAINSLRESEITPLENEVKVLRILLNQRMLTTKTSITNA